MTKTKVEPAAPSSEQPPSQPEPAQPEPVKAALEQSTATQPVQQEIIDPISQRIEVTTKALREAGADEKMIQDAVMAILKPGVTYSTGDDDKNSWRERNRMAAEPHAEYGSGEGKKEAS